MSKTASTGATLTLVDAPRGHARDERDVVAVWRQHATGLLIASSFVTLAPADRRELATDLKLLTGELGRPEPRMDLVAVLLDIVHETFRAAWHVPDAVERLLADRPADDEVRDRGLGLAPIA